MKAGFEGDEQARGPHCSDFLGDVNKNSGYAFLEGF